MKENNDMAKRGQLSRIEQEFADFVDTHDTSEMVEKGQLKEVKDFKISVPTRKKAITIKLYPALLNRIKRIAETQQIPYQSLINQWLAERTYYEERRRVSE